MKKVISIILFAVLAVAVSVMSVALELLPIQPIPPVLNGRRVIIISNVGDIGYVTSPHGETFYIMMEDQPWEDVTVIGNGIVSASYVDFDPEEMIAMDKNGNDLIPYSIIYESTGEVIWEGLTYETAKEEVEYLNSLNEGNYYFIPQININIIKIVVGENYSASYKLGNAIITATLNGKEYKGCLDILSDVFFKHIKDSEELAEATSFFKETVALKRNGTSFMKLSKSASEIETNPQTEEFDFIGSISIDRWPDKTVYNVGETIDLTGMKVTAVAYKLDEEKNLYIPFEIDVTDLCWAEPSVVTYDEDQNVTVYLKAPCDQSGNIRTFSDKFRITVNPVYEEDNGSEEYEPIYSSIELNIGKDPGCSSYLAHVSDYYEDANTPATVLTTKAFALAAGGKATVNGDFFTITIPQISNKQKGVNFYYEMEFSPSYEDEKKIELRFYSDTIIQSDYDVRINLGINYYELREFFETRVEEENVISFFVYDEEGVCIGKNTVDFLKIDAEKEASFYIEEKAGETLKKYTISVKGPENASDVPELNDTLSIAKKKIIQNGQTTVSVNLSEGSGVAAAQFAIKYDTSVLKLVSASAGELMSDAAINTETPGKIIFGWDDTDSVTEGGTILELTFTTAEGAGIGTTAVEIDETEKFVFTKANLGELSIDVENGIVTIIDAVYGDLTGDGEVDIRDAYLARLIAAKLRTPTETQLIVGDVDGDGKITAVDANYIRKHSVRLISEFPIEQK